MQGQIGAHVGRGAVLAQITSTDHHQQQPTSARVRPMS
jgi:hypothetical protein